MILIMKALRIYLTGLYLCLIKYIFDKQITKSIICGKPVTGKFVNFISKKCFKLTEKFNLLEHSFIMSVKK